MGPYGEWVNPPDTGNAEFDAIAAIVLTLVLVVSAAIFIFYKVAWSPLWSMLKDVRATQAVTQEDLKIAKTNVMKAVKDTAVIREQTENSHASAPIPNLRDNIDANHGEIITTLIEIKTDFKEMRKDIGGLRQENREDREQMGQIGARLDRHINEKSDFIPRLIEVEHQLKKVGKNEKEG